jgi:hypothetical protein
VLRDIHASCTGPDSSGYVGSVGLRNPHATVYSEAVKLFRALKNFFWGKAGTPEEEAARAEALRIKQEGRREALTGHGRYKRR